MEWLPGGGKNYDEYGNSISKSSTTEASEFFKALHSSFESETKRQDTETWT